MSISTRAGKNLGLKKFLGFRFFKFCFRFFSFFRFLCY